MTSETDGKKGMGIADLLRHPVVIFVSLFWTFLTFELGAHAERSYSEAPVPDAANCVDFCDTRGGVKSFSYRLAEPADARRGPQPNANTSCVCLNGASISKDPSPKDSRLPMITRTLRTLTQDDREKLAKVLAHVNSKVDPGWELFDDPLRDGMEHRMQWRRRDGASFYITKPWRKERWFEIRPDYPSVELSNGRRVSTDPYAYDDAKGCHVYIGLEARAGIDRPVGAIGNRFLKVINAYAEDFREARATIKAEQEKSDRVINYRRDVMGEVFDKTRHRASEIVRVRGKAYGVSGQVYADDEEPDGVSVRLEVSTNGRLWRLCQAVLDGRAIVRMKGKKGRTKVAASSRKGTRRPKNSRADVGDALVRLDEQPKKPTLP